MKLSTMRRAYLREAAFMLIIARLAVRILPPAWIFGWVKRPLRHTRRFAADEAVWVGWSVETIGAKVGMNNSCFPCALAAQAMLKRRGIVSRLCLGVACDDDSAFSAHAWIEVDHDVIVGGANAGRFTQVTRFGGIVHEPRFLG